MASKRNRREFLQSAAAAAVAGAAGVRPAAARARNGGGRSNIYMDKLNLRPVINGVGTVTVLGGSLMPPEVVNAMAEASRHFVPLPELQKKVGERIAQLVGVPAAMVSCGAASAITVATAACLVSGNREKLRQLPDTTGLRNEVVLQKSHRSGYEAQIELTGARLVWVETLAELERAIGERTAMLFFLNKSDSSGQIKRADWIRIGKERNVPTFNDAAADVPPVERLSAYVKEGFDLVAFSGGKGLLGPQNSGLLFGRPDLVEAAQHAISPHGGIGRGMKVGKEEIMGLLAAVERYVKVDHAAEYRLLEKRVADIVEALSPVEGVRANREVPEIANQVPHAVLEWDETRLGLTSQQLAARLREGDPSIEVSRFGAGKIRISVWMMQRNEHRTVARRLREIFAGTSHT